MNIKTTEEIEQQAREKLSELANLKPEDNPAFDWASMGLSSVFAYLYKDKMCYVPEAKSWYTYTDGVWQYDLQSIELAQCMREFNKIMKMYATSIEESEKRDAYFKVMKKMEHLKPREDILKDARSEMARSIKEFDKNPYLLNLKNGTYNLLTLEFYKHRSSDFLTMMCNAEYNEGVKDKRWEKFIDEVTENDKDKSSYIKRALGYSITGVNNEECMFILHGKTTRNGKSTLLNTISNLLGSYSGIAEPGIICRGARLKNTDGATPSLASLKGKRFVTMAESSQYGRLDEEKVKQLTGGEEITARGLFQSPFNYLPQFTMWLSCNDLPQAHDKSLFTSNRLRVVEFNRHFSEKEQDISLKQKFTQNEKLKSAILNWLIEGYKEYIKERLVLAPHLKEVITRYEKENDLILMFLENACEKVENGDLLTLSEIYQRYVQWAITFNFPTLTIHKVKKEIEKHPDWLRDGQKGEGLSITYSTIAIKQSTATKNILKRLRGQ